MNLLFPLPKRLQSQIHPSLAYLHFIEALSDFTVEKVNTIDTLETYRKIRKGPFISASEFSNAIGHAVALAENTNDLIAFIANFDLSERIKLKHKQNTYNIKTFYTHNDADYTDYLFYTGRNSHF
ncbi:uncharacterized protein BX663DRAFT_544067 [Cokeromyces recurvatus]|uniref:uncharacterized protein n=1 Tax=Cokeromyces recurvatus TaxID=90255 RepID=UPI002220C239|nr:uncharacterized protein BX663DRAFT_544067 [Cokeromyces recurvatus]KAI7901749.1 hypothetical protein BX663DRAFT_544067 [Cokeromyces recurvatus]